MRGILSFALMLAFAATGSAADAAGDEFFEKKIRPLLVEHCQKCHSSAAEKANKLKGSLRLDARAGWQTGGDSGPTVVPGKPNESLLLQTMLYEGDVKMPPAGKLPAAAIRDVEAWIAMGAPDPRTAAGAARKGGMSLEEGKHFWAYKPVAKPAIPAVKDAAWPASDADRFILAALEAKRLAPAPDADRATLARRVYFDLTGLPPSPAEVDAFVADTSPHAYGKLVDRLLASPAFGERWGRHWLDVSRYAESVTLRGFIFKEAWRYRDYAIDSFNADVPFNRFLREQVAGDLLPANSPAERARNLVATTFLLLGNTNLEEQDKKQLRMDVVDEQLDAIAKGFLAQTVTCARCHDHKFDPIPTKDYYALAGILRNVKSMEHSNVSAWTEVPLPMDAAGEAALKKHDAAVAALQAKLKRLVGTAATGVLAVKDAPGVVVDDARAKKVGTWQDSKANGTYIGDGYTHDQDGDKGTKTITFSPALPADGKYEVWLAYSPGANRAKNVPVTVFSADGEKSHAIDMTKPPPVEGRYASLGTYNFEAAGQSFVIVANEGTVGHVAPDAVLFLAPDAPRPAGGREKKAAEDELKALVAGGPKRPKAMAPVEEANVEETRVHVRGNVHNLGEPSPRGVLRVVGGAAPFPANQSGRRELADWIASDANPLTSRVIVNRAWHWLFGAGLVRTADNFGTTGEMPSHPELLDHLAAKFVADGWSMKKLVRALVLSRTYRQAAGATPSDPENRLFGHANRRRLEGEAIRDAILVVGGRLDPARGGPTYPAALASDYNFRSPSLRRSVYLPMFRNSMPELLEQFDAADPSTVTGRRNASTVAPQALLLLNHPFVAEQATAAADRLLAEAHGDDAARLRRAYRLALGRLPTAGEEAAALKFVAKSPAPRDAWAGVFHAIFASADFRRLD